MHDQLKSYSGNNFSKHRAPIFLFIKLQKNIELIHNKLFYLNSPEIVSIILVKREDSLTGFEEKGG
ncbi:MAG TPA: hypothetical protein DCW46_01575 [Desulfotomaculum sp.]|nr:hypothetical protein [Desulfotomaculum sp.]